MCQDPLERKRELINRVSESRLSFLDAADATCDEWRKMRALLPSSQTIGVAVLGMGGAYLVGAKLSSLLSPSELVLVPTADGVIAPAKHKKKPSNLAKIFRFALYRGVLMFAWPLLKTTLAKQGGEALLGYISKSDVNKIVSKLFAAKSNS